MLDKPLEGSLRRKVDRKLSKGADPEEIAALLVQYGWDPNDAMETAEREDRRRQDELRENNMARTHVPRNTVVRTGAPVLGVLFAIWVILKLVRLLHLLH